MWYWIFRAILIVILKLFFRLKVEGVRKLPKKTNFIVVANHTSFLDPFVLIAAIPQRIHWITKRSIYQVPWIKWFMSISHSLPTGSSSQKAISLLIKNKNVGLFPEGTRSFDGKLKNFKRGMALLAIKAGKPIVPCAIFGTYQAFPRKAKMLKFRPLKVKIGKSRLLLKEIGDRVDDVALQKGVFEIKNIIKEMLNA